MIILTHSMFFLLLAAVPNDGKGASTKKPRTHPLALGTIGISREYEAWVKYIYQTESTTTSTPAPYIKNATVPASDGGFYTMGLCAGTPIGKCHVMQWKAP